MGRKDKDRGEPSVNGNSTAKEKEKEKDKDVPGRPSGSGSGGGGPTFGVTQSSGSSSFFNVPSNSATPHADDASATLHPDDSPRRSHSPARSKNLPPIPRDFAGAEAGAQQQQQGPPTNGELSDREAFESVGQNTLSVRFEINVVKVCHQFLVLYLMVLYVFFVFRFPGCRYTVSNSVVRAEMDGSTRCLRDES